VISTVVVALAPMFITAAAPASDAALSRLVAINCENDAREGALQSASRASFQQSGITGPEKAIFLSGITGPEKAIL
jgi:hypothetical protein